jgi:kumamolisin
MSIRPYVSHYPRHLIHPYYHLPDTHSPQPLVHRTGFFPPPPPGAWTIPALCKRYGFVQNSLHGRGKIGVFEAGGGWNWPDIVLFCREIGAPVPKKITDVSVDGTDNNHDLQDPATVEVELDLEILLGTFWWLTGEMPEIDVFWSQSFSAAYRMATDRGCRVMSTSWGAPASYWGQPGLPETPQDVDDAAAYGIEKGMITGAASGDRDEDDGTQKKTIDIPAGCPHVRGDGGTTLTETDEKVWNNGPDDGTGGGWAPFPVQPWQVGVPTPPEGFGRMVPDMAAVADPNTGYVIVVGGHQMVVGGTSGACPFNSAVIAAAAPGELNFLNPVLYANPSAFNLNISGNNGPDYSQPPNPGPCTGMGSPNGSAFAAMVHAAARLDPAGHS